MQTDLQSIQQPTRYSNPYIFVANRMWPNGRVHQPQHSFFLYYTQCQNQKIELYLPIFLLVIEILLGKEVSNIFVISLHNKFTTHQVLSEFGQGMHDGQHLLIIYRIQPFMWLQFSTLNSNRMPILHQDNSNSYTRSITFHQKRFGKIRQGKYWITAHYLFQLLKNIFSLLTPTECTLLSQICQGCSIPGVSFDKSAILVTKANEASQFNEVPWAGPFQYGLYFSGSTLNPSWQIT